MNQAPSTHRLNRVCGYRADCLKPHDKLSEYQKLSEKSIICNNICVMQFQELNTQVIALTGICLCDWFWRWPWKWLM